MDKILNPSPPIVSQGRLSWHLSKLLLPRLCWLNLLGGWLTLWDSFGTPGDTLLTAAVARVIKHRFPSLKLNCITPNPELLKHDSAINSLNGPPSQVLLRFWYLEIIHGKDGVTNILGPTLAQAGIRDYEYRSRVFLTDCETEDARMVMSQASKPIITINVQSREKVKVWPESRWQELVNKLSSDYEVVQLGAQDEPEIEGTMRLAGKLSLRQSMACLSLARLHIGSVSFLMHAANGLGVASVIIYGGRETPKNSGYAQNENLYSAMPCSPCWLHDSHGDRCPHQMKCMDDISVDQVFGACLKILKKKE